MKKLIKAVILSLAAFLFLIPSAVSAAEKTIERTLETEIETQRLYVQVRDTLDEGTFTKRGETVQLAIMDWGKPELTSSLRYGCSNGEVVHLSEGEIKPAVIETGSMPLEGDALFLTLTAGHNGTADLHIETADGAEEIIIHMTVNDPAYAVSGIIISTKNITLQRGSQAAVKYTITPDTAENKTVYWSSDRPEIASVDDAGTVTGNKPGTAVITAETADGSFKDTCTVTVEKKKAENVKISESEISLLPGKSRKLNASYVPADADDVRLVWSSSDASVAKVGADGTVTALKEGTAVITVKDQESARSASCKVSVVKKIKADPVIMYRLYNPNSGEHFYTASTVEMDRLVTLGWIYEGSAWTAPSKSHTPVYRLYNKNAGDHHYTSSLKEKNALVSYGWKDEGIGWYSDDEQTVAVYREYNPNEAACNHNYTPSLKEHTTLVSYGWRDEGTAWYALKEGTPAVKVASLGRGTSPFYIQVNRTANTVTIYCKDSKGNYTTAYKALVCSCGTDAHRTPKQDFVTGQKLRWHHLIHGVSGQYCTRFAGNSRYTDILFHSVPYTSYGNPGSLQYNEYNKLGSCASAGCVRLCVRDAKWIYDNVPQGTKIHVYESSDPGPLGKPVPIKINTSSKNRGWDPTDPDPANPWNK